VRPILLIRLVPTALSVKIAFQPLRRQQQPLRPRACNRVRVLPAALLELAAGAAQPPLPTLNAGDDPLCIKLELTARCRLRVWLGLLAVGLLPQLLLLRRPKELRASLRRAQLLRQLIAIQLILSLVSRPRLGEDLPHDLLKLTIGATTSVPRQTSAVDRDQLRLDQPRPIAQPQHLTEQLRQRRLMPNDEPGDRRMIRHHVPRDHSISHVLATVTLDRTR
jgi:hypothetical protein